MLNSLDLPGRPEDTRVVVAMSGGVDSSVVAALMKEEGYEVIGVTLQLYDHGAAVSKAKSCCAGVDIHDARRAAEKIGIPHYVLDYESRFKEQVMDRFADSYIAGETPIPCVSCNQTVKFTDLLKTAKDLGADVLATGHYVRSRPLGNKRALFRPTDLDRDQSYFLFATTQAQLDFLPESSTDFVYAVIGEEFGFIGIVILLLLYLFVVGRALFLSMQMQDTFARLLSGSLSLTFFVYVFINRKTK